MKSPRFIVNINNTSEEITFDAITFNCYQSIIRDSKAYKELEELWGECEGHLVTFSNAIYNYLCERNPFSILDISNPASTVYWTAVQSINYIEIAKGLNEYFTAKTTKIEEF